MVPVRQFRLKLCHWKYDGIYVSAQAGLCVSERADDLPKTNISNHRQVDVALRTFRPLRQRSENKSDSNPVSERVKAQSKHICNAGCLLENRSKFLEDWARITGREKNVPSTCASL